MWLKRRLLRNKTSTLVCTVMLAFVHDTALAQTGPTPAFGLTVNSPSVSIDGFSSPESVAWGQGRYFVSNMGKKLDPVGKDDDGFISEIDESGQIVALRAFPSDGSPLHSPKGLVVMDGMVLAADIDRVVGYDLETRALVFEAALPGDKPALLNDLAVLDGATLLVTDTLRNAVYQLDLDSRTYSTLASNIPGPNGIAVDENRGAAFVAAIGEGFSGGDVFRLDLVQRSQPEKLAGAHGLLDGIAVLAGGDLLISDWVSASDKNDGRLLLRSAAGLISEIQIGENHGPADLAYEGNADRLWIPLMLDNQVLMIDLGPGE